MGRDLLTFFVAYLRYNDRILCMFADACNGRWGGLWRAVREPERQFRDHAEAKRELLGNTL